MNEVTAESNPFGADFKIKTLNGYVKYIGKFEKRDLTYRAEVTGQQKFQKGDCFKVDVDLLRHLDQRKCEKVIFKEVATGHLFSISYDKFLTKGWQYPKDCNLKVQGIFQPSWMCARKWFRERYKGIVINEPEE